MNDYIFFKEYLGYYIFFNFFIIGKNKIGVSPLGNFKQKIHYYYTGIKSNNSEVLGFMHHDKIDVIEHPKFRKRSEYKIVANGINIGELDHDGISFKNSVPKDVILYVLDALKVSVRFSDTKKGSVSRSDIDSVRNHIYKRNENTTYKR